MSRAGSSLKRERKLTWEQVNAIRSEYRWHSSSSGGAALARHYGVSTNTINKIVRGRTWRVRPGDGNQPAPSVRPRPNWKAFAEAQLRSAHHLQTLASLLQFVQNHPDEGQIEEWLLSVTLPTPEAITFEENDVRHTDNTLFCNDNLHERAFLET